MGPLGDEVPASYRAHDMTKITEPTPFQARAMAVPERINLALLGGRGGGKTTAATLLALRHCVQYEEQGPHPHHPLHLQVARQFLSRTRTLDRPELEFPGLRTAAGRGRRRGS